MTTIFSNTNKEAYAIACVNCLHYVPAKLTGTPPIPSCDRSVNHIDPVTGRIHINPCSRERSETGSCKPKGIYFVKARN